MNLDQIPSPTPELIWRVLEDGAVIVTPESGRVTVFNDVGTFIWGLMDGNNRVTDIISRLVQQYKVENEQAQNDVLAFLGDLDERGLLIWKN
ncbi:MAG: PqqD family protein [Chloroflexi bacterium]|nr:PqqD family protein [Chloroflexota bacterium]MCI0580030.1 PqqD family protein [Chloroflexota bacterium]MCI0646775.1 PqqD family protein [Chloroflexota bacterium]MCI0730197.1 PqqD family protein [Chloroflexota bacterium]